MRRRPFIALILPIALCGCGKPSPEEAIIGSWTGDPPLAAELKNDPTFRPFVEALAGAIELDLNEDHTYELRTWATKTGKWKVLNNLVLFEETGSRSPFQGSLAESLEFGKLDGSGKRSYSAVLSKKKTEITLLMGSHGEVVFHR